MPSFVWRPISDNKKGNFPVRRHECERLQTERRVDGRSTLWQIARRTGCMTEWQAIASGSNNPQSAANFSGRHRHCVTPSPLAHFWALSLLALPVQLDRSARLSHRHYNSAGLVPRANYQDNNTAGKNVYGPELCRNVFMYLETFRAQVKKCCKKLQYVWFIRIFGSLRPYGVLHERRMCELPGSAQPQHHCRLRKTCIHEQGKGLGRMT